MLLRFKSKFPSPTCDKYFGGMIVYGTVYTESCSKYMYLNGSNSIKVILVCVILGSAHKVSVFSSIEFKRNCEILNCGTVTISRHLGL